MKRSIVTALVLGCSLFASSYALSHAADYISSAFPSDQILEELSWYRSGLTGAPEDYIIVGKAKLPTDKTAYVVYGHYVSNDSPAIEIILKKTDRNYWYYNITPYQGNPKTGILQTSY
jgi:hypothetical protein